MAASLLVLLDDIASVLDDVAVLTKRASAQTAGVLGDDLALNAQQVSGVQAERELPVVWAVAKGSLLNKLILVPLALAVSALAPVLVTVLLMVGGAYLCFEGAEKVLHALLHRRTHGTDSPPPHADAVGADAQASAPAKAPPSEKEKIRGAIRTDFVLSAEIIVITLGTVAAASLAQRIAVLAMVAVLMTVGVYGVVAAIVKLDDLGLWLMRRRSTWPHGIGRGLLYGTPWLMRALGVAGTVAMFLVGGGILAHGLAPLLPWLHHAQSAGAMVSVPAHLLTGFAAGCVLVATLHGLGKIRALFA